MRGREVAYILISRFVPVYIIYDGMAKVYSPRDLGASPELFEALEACGLLPVPEVLLRQNVECEVSLFAYLFGRYDEYLSYPGESDRWFRDQFEEWKTLIQYLEADTVVQYEDFARGLSVRATLETLRAECHGSALETLDTWDERFIRLTVEQSGYLEVHLPGLPPKLQERVPKRIDPGSQVLFDLVVYYKNRCATGQDKR
ncbi:MAG: hypothetical protein ACOYON_08750 [Fimbriimonas sp.]